MSNENSFLNMDDPAFSYAAEWGYSKGLTKRELFAAMAMQGILSNSSIFDNIQEMGEKDPTITVALAAIEHADALINALNDQK